MLPKKYTSFSLYWKEIYSDKKKRNRHDIAEILLKVALNTIKHKNGGNVRFTKRIYEIL